MPEDVIPEEARHEGAQMSEGALLAAAASGRDPVTGLRAIRALRDLTDRLEALQVDNARRQGWSWQTIAVHLGVSRQAAHKKHARRRRG
jgi:hypothetical protein